MSPEQSKHSMSTGESYKTGLNKKGRDHHIPALEINHSKH